MRKKLSIRVTRQYVVEYKHDPSEQICADEEPWDENTLIDEVEAWAHDLLVDETIDGDQLVNFPCNLTGVEILSSEHSEGLGELSIETEDISEEIQEEEPKEDA